MHSQGNFMAIFWHTLRQFSVNESPLKMVKNAFCFTLKAFLVLKIFKFLCWIFRRFAKQLWAYSWINNVKFYTACVYCMASWGLSKYIEKRLQTTRFYLIETFFEKISLPTTFHCFCLLHEIQPKMCIVIVP